MLKCFGVLCIACCHTLYLKRMLLPVFSCSGTWKVQRVPALLFSLHAARDLSLIRDLQPLLAELIHFWKLLSLVTCSHFYFGKNTCMRYWRCLNQAWFLPPSSFFLNLFPLRGCACWFLHPVHVLEPFSGFGNDCVTFKALHFKIFIRNYFRR